MRLPPKAILVVGGILFLLLGYLGVHQGMVPYAQSAAEIEAQLREQAEAALAEHGAANVRIEMDGQKVLVREAGGADREALERTLLASEGAGGLFRGGVTKVLFRSADRRDDSIPAPTREPVIADGEPRPVPTFAEEAAAEPNALPVVSPYILEARRIEDGGVRLTGSAPSETIRGQIVEHAASVFSGGVQDDLKLAAGQPAGPWREAVALGLSQLARIEDGAMTMSGEALVLTGSGSEQLRAAVQKELNRMPGRFVGNAAIDTGGTAITDAPAIRDVESCQNLFNTLMQRRIEFRWDSVEIDPDSYPLLRDLASTALRCQDFTIIVTGHTDGSGDPAYNLQLSRDRANSVRDYLIALGVSQDRLTAQGRGQSEPIADNATAEGRARNRRIEFTVAQ